MRENKKIKRIKKSFDVKPLDVFRQNLGEVNEINFCLYILKRK